MINLNFSYCQRGFICVSYSSSIYLKKVRLKKDQHAPYNCHSNAMKESVIFFILFCNCYLSPKDVCYFRCCRKLHRNCLCQNIFKFQHTLFYINSLVLTIQYHISITGVISFLSFSEFLTYYSKRRGPSCVWEA